MRRLVDIVALLTAALLIGGGAYYELDRAERLREVDRVAADVRRVQGQISLRAATKETELNSRGWPVTVDPSWFAQDPTPPRNTLLSNDRPWLEVATLDEADLLDPEVRIAINERVASFWYNPYQGVVRTRVPFMISDRKALELYNRLNDSDLGSIFERHAIAPSAPAARPEPEPAAPSNEPVAGHVDPYDLPGAGPK